MGDWISNGDNDNVLRCLTLSHLNQELQEWKVAKWAKNKGLALQNYSYSLCRQCRNECSFLASVFVTTDFLNWTHFRLGFLTAMYLRMRSATPPEYLDLWEGSKRLSRMQLEREQSTSEQDWKASDHCSISVVSSKLAKDNHGNASHSSNLETLREYCTGNGQQLELHCAF